MSELPDLTLIAAVISSIINCPVKTYDECIAEGLDPNRTLDPVLVHKYSVTNKNISFKKFVEKSNRRSSKNDPAPTYSGINEINEDDDEIDEDDDEIDEDDDEIDEDDDEIDEDDDEIDEDNSKIDEDNEIDERSRSQSVNLPSSSNSSSIQVFLFFLSIALLNQVDNDQHPQPIQIFFKFSEESRSIFISPDITVLELKKKIQAMLCIDMISLSFSSKPLEDHRTLKSYNINQNDTIHASCKLLGGGVINYFVLNNQFFDPYHNWNLTDIKMGQNYVRGGRVYAPPYGWNRIGLNTTSRYGKGKWMSNDASKSWPVSYNGVNRDRAETTVIRGQEQTKQQFTKYGKGIYSTPDIKYAEQYAINRRKQIWHNNDSRQVHR
ncbi:unnamed protein product [Rhizophagus irregularis]|nr:unnamed protein product [Rhizophagus irregularis]